MNENFRSIVLQKTGASSLVEKEIIQDLWSGYGKIIRVALENASVENVIVKHIRLPANTNHPRGWNTDIGHQRKIHSYLVETTWYDRYSEACAARLPHCLAIVVEEEEVLIVLEDLDEAGFDIRKNALTWQEISSCLAWLAKFHASYLGQIPVAASPSRSSMSSTRASPAAT